MSKPYAIRVSSQKGGVGKTTVAVNLSAALADMGYKVLLADADLSNPSVGFHLGLEDANIGMAAVLTNKTSLDKAIVMHDATGMRVLPGEVNNRLGSPSPRLLRVLTEGVSRMDLDFVVMDTSPGFSWDGMQYFYDEALIITTPDLPALSSVLRLADIYDSMHIKHSLVVNRLKHRRYEVDVREMERSYGKNAQAILPESDVVPRSIAAHIPAVLLDSKDPFSKSASELGEDFTYRTGSRPKAKQYRKRGMLSMLIEWLQSRLG